ncbi:hypothetical protein [Haloarchaeobius sp. HME9146]|uniref:hypothetical protein n=1 Tax=Haloarchaeobius sp. HME9146 TaxID=2978732 RepID=UPI0021C1E5EF|nr:hypothetical protein [Haloarchaeobius sp. HME9146]
MDTDSTRRRFLLRAGAAAAVSGLAGCTSDSGGSPEGDESDTQTATATATDTATATATETATDEPATTASQAASFCQPITGSPTAYEVADTPYVFAFDYIDSWTVEDPLDRSNARIQRIVSPELTSEGSASSATVRVGQSLEAVTASKAESEIEAAIEREGSSGVAYEEEFNGETVRFVEFPNVDVNSYTTYLPYGDGDARYYAFSLVTFLDIGNSNVENIGDCTDAVNVATQTVRGSLAVNTESTIDQT